MALTELIEQIDKLTVLELADLVKRLEEKYGVSAAAPMAMMAAGPAAAPAPEAEKTEFDVILAEIGRRRSRSSRRFGSSRVSASPRLRRSSKARLRPSKRA